MVDGTRPDGTAEDDPVKPDPLEELITKLEAEGVDLEVRTPIAAVSVGKVGGTYSLAKIVVVCSDGACFERTAAGAWQELEPIPGTLRAGQMQSEPLDLCGTMREFAGPSSMCVLTMPHEPPHVDATGFRWE